MANKIVEKIFKVFFVFLSTVLLLGFLFMTIRNYMMPVVNSMSSESNGVLKQKYYFKGEVKPKKIIEIRADKKMYISDIYVETGQIVEPESEIIAFDTTKQTFNSDVAVQNLKNDIKSLEIEKLNYKKQIDISKKNLDEVYDDYMKSLSDYNESKILYNNNVITQKSFEATEDEMNKLKLNYNNLSDDYNKETVIYNMNIDKINNQIKVKQIEITGTNTEDTEYKLIVSADGIYKLTNKIYVEYITEEKVVNKGDVIIRYSNYDSNSDAYIEASVDHDTYDKITSDMSSIHYWKIEESKQCSAKIYKKKEFADHCELFFELSSKSGENILISDNVKFVADVQKNYELVLDKTVIVPIGQLKEGNNCYVYIIEKEDSILGNKNYLSRVVCTIEAIGDTKVALSCAADPKAEILKTGMYPIVNYASSLYTDGMQVRLEIGR